MSSPLSTPSTHAIVMRVSVIEHMREFYERTGVAPVHSLGNIPESRHQARHHFGSWSAAVKAAGIPSKERGLKEVKCTQCGIKLIRRLSQLRKSQNPFCTASCTAKYYKTGVKLSDEAKKRMMVSRRNTDKRTQICSVCYSIHSLPRRETCSPQCLKVLLQVNAIKRRNIVHV